LLFPSLLAKKQKGVLMAKEEIQTRKGEKNDLVKPLLTLPVTEKEELDGSITPVLNVPGLELYATMPNDEKIVGVQWYNTRLYIVTQKNIYRLVK
jgi:hypothetical protein